MSNIHWIILFIYSWVIFLIFIDFKRINRTFYGGLIAFALGTMVDWAGHQLHLYEFHENVINWMGNSFFYAFGPLFTMGTLFFQFLNPDRRIQAANIAVFTVTYFCVEILIVSTGGASYINWHYTASLAVDILVFTAMSYVGEAIVFTKSGIESKEGGS